jgi:hypothetical protein
MDTACFTHSQTGARSTETRRYYHYRQYHLRSFRISGAPGVYEGSKWSFYNADSPIYEWLGIIGLSAIEKLEYVLQPRESPPLIFYIQKVLGKIESDLI